jgi:membrane protein YdbS with pleckstrin-like domain
VSGKVIALCIAAGAAVVALGALGAVIASAIGLYLVSFVGIVLVTIRLDWELRDSLIGTRSIRLREGAWVQREITLSYANVQNVEVTQGPLERLFGFQNLRISTAGGAGAAKAGQASTHDATLVGLTNAQEVRELVLGAVRRQRDAGLGDKHDGPSREELLIEVRDAARALATACTPKATRS